MGAGESFRVPTVPWLRSPLPMQSREAPIYPRRPTLRMAINRPLRGRARGFTLIEVMAALVIVSLGMLAVIQAVSETANNGAYLRDKSVAHWVAMNRITELRLAAQPPTVGESSGEVEMA